MSELTLSVLRQLRDAGGEELLPRLHHFWSEKFASRPPSFQKHWEYSIGVDESKGGENEQTRERIKAALRAHDNGQSWDDAIRCAWKEFPIVTR